MFFHCSTVLIYAVRQAWRPDSEQAKRLEICGSRTRPAVGLFDWGGQYRDGESNAVGDADTNRHPNSDANTDADADR
jgi:hypothetical protein